jgi:hypothetical protein
MSITTHTLDAGRWLEYFESIGPALDGSLVTIEVMDEQIGDQVEAERLPLQAIGYDPNDNVMEIAVGRRGLRYPVLLRHFISRPQTIAIEETGKAAPSAILVTDADDQRTLIRLFEPSALEA